VVLIAPKSVVGRLASLVAMRLRGKHLPTYTLMSIAVTLIIINAAHAC